MESEPRGAHRVAMVALSGTAARATLLRRGDEIEGPDVKAWLSRAPVPAFFVLAFAIAWTAWAIVLPLEAGCPAVRALLVLPAASPALAAGIVGRRLPQGQCPPGLGARFAPRRDLVLPTLLALALAVAFVVVPRLTQHLLPSVAFPELPAGDPRAVLVALALAIAANPWEELGWRGFALPRLADRIGTTAAAIVIGLLAGLWHLPLFVWSGSGMSRYPYYAWLSGFVASSLVTTRLWTSSRGSLLVTSVFHVALNTFSVAFGIASFVVYAASALGIALAFRPGIAKRLAERTLSRSRPVGPRRDR